MDNKLRFLQTIKSNILKVKSDAVKGDFHYTYRAFDELIDEVDKDIELELYNEGFALDMSKGHVKDYEKEYNFMSKVGENEEKDYNYYCLLLSWFTSTLRDVREWSKMAGEDMFREGDD